MISGSVAVPSSRSAPVATGPLRRPGHVEDIVEDLKGEANLLSEGSELRARAVALDRPELARGAEQDRRLPDGSARKVAIL